MRRVITLACLAVTLSGPAAAQHVPLGESFGPLEQSLVAEVVSFDLLLFAFQSDLTFGRAPLIGGPPGFDRDVSEALYRGPGAGKWLGGVPDAVGIAIAPAAAFAVYGSDALVFVLRGHAWSGDENPDHALLALTEAYAISLGLDQAAKVFVGRERPRVALARPDAPPPSVDDRLSFFSGHSTSSFVLAAFVSRDVGDWLVAGPLAEADPAERFWLGRFVPAAVLYGAAGVVGVSRIIDQAHYLSDVLVGAAVGTLVGNLVYSAHFDDAGQPRRSAPAAELTALPLGLGGGLALRGRF
jgi:membrane-associated phospholipid phosphatase